MKKFLCALIIVLLLFSPKLALAGINLKNIGESVLSKILVDVINDALKKNGMGDLISDDATSSDAEAKTPTENKIPKNSGKKVTELSEEQYQSFSEICLAGSLEEFRKKIEYENISHEAKYTKEDGSVITLLELAKTSPNPELAEFLEADSSENEQ
ncbi:MAG: hypothetical protein IJ597_07790 [Synergistaceae bacterium]|nr:hypothetical protein [Synergistaceae bacterium]